VPRSSTRSGLERGFPDPGAHRPVGSPQIVPALPQRKSPFDPPTAGQRCGTEAATLPAVNIVLRPRRSGGEKSSDSANRGLYNKHVLAQRTANDVLLVETGPALSENSRLGFGSTFAPREVAVLFAKMNSTLGMHIGLLEDCGGSRVQTWNRYAYVANNPLNAIDLFGLQCVTLDNGVVGDDGTEPPCKSMTQGSGAPDVSVDGGDWVLQGNCVQFGGSPGVGCDGGGWRNIDLIHFHLPQNVHIPIGPVVSQQPQTNPQPSQQTGACRPGQHCTEAYKQCESRLFYHAFGAGVYATGAAISGLPDEVKQLWQYVSTNKYALGAAASATATSMYALGEATSATIGAAVSNVIIPAGAGYLGYWAGKQGIDAYKQYVDQNSGNCERL